MNSNFPYIDSHFHLIQCLEKGIKPERMLNEASDAGVKMGMDIGIDLDAIDFRRSILSATSGSMQCGYTIGLYPSFASLDRVSLDKKIKQLDIEIEKRYSDPLLWAIGEIGLDFHWNYGSKEKQIELFHRQVELAQKYNLPIVIHNREADNELYAVLKTIKGSGVENFQKKTGILHCYSSSPEFLEKCIELGFYISFAGNLSFANSTEIHASAKLVPLERLLFETDSPYLSPVPFRGKVNQPARVVQIYNYLADLRNTNVALLKKQVYKNFTTIVDRSLL